MAVLVENFRSGFITSAISDIDTTITSADFADLRVVSSPDVMKIVLDPKGSGGPPEIVTITDHVAASTTVTVTRSSGRAHSSNTRWVHSALAEDYQRVGFEGTATLDGLTVDTDTLHVDAANNRVGIGTTAPGTTLEVAGDVTITGGLTVQGAGGYDMEVFTSSGSFTKATYPWARNIRVRVVGGGGGSGAAVATSASQISVGGAGAAGGYAESVVAVSALAASETVTVGTGGAAGTSGGNGGDGTASSFGTHAAANGGTGGFFGGAQGAPGRSGNGGTGGSATAGDLQIKGGDGERLVVASISRIETTVGGTSSLSNIRGRRASTTTQGGTAGNDYGGGANGPANAASQVARDGSAGADGIVIVEIFG